MKNAIIFLSLALIFSPILAVMGTTPVNNPTVVAPKDYDSPFLVAEGTTIYYDINTFTIPSGPDFSGIDFSGNTLYVKILYVQDDYDFGGGTTGVLVYYAIGIIFNNDESITIGTGTEALNVIIPSGAATPGAILTGAPHFNTSGEVAAPLVFALNTDWDDHETMFGLLGFTIDTNDATTFEVSYSGVNGTVNGQWRKSDGICTYLHYDNFTMIELPPGYELELTLDHVEVTALSLNVGDSLSIYLDTFDVQVTGTGMFSAIIDQANVTESISEIQNTFVDKELQKFVVTDIRGTFIRCEVYGYDETTDSLVLETEDAVFNAFLFSVPVVDDPFTEEFGYSIEYIPSFSPWITQDWTIYGGVMKLTNVIFDIYEQLLSFAAPDPDEVTINTFTGGMELKQKRSFYYFTSTLSIDVEINATIEESLGLMNTEAVYDEEVHAIANLESYVCYHESGTLAVVRDKGDITINYLNATGNDPGDLSVTFDLKFRNRDYNPPDLIGGGFIPGFTWLLAIPTLLGLASLGLIRRRRA